MKFNFQSNKIATVFPFAILLIFLRIAILKNIKSIANGNTVAILFD